jgi:hypothetical protein
LLSASWRLISLATLAVTLSACSDFADLQHNVCGNGIIEPGEDCDSSDPTCVRCAVTCHLAADCPSADYACGVDGFCHAPGGALASPTAPVTFSADELRITDVDHDGIGDVLGLSNTSLVVRHGDAAGSLTTLDSFVTPAQSGPAGFGDLDGDGVIDVTLSTRDGLVTYASPFGDPAPVDVASPITAQDGTALDIAMMFPVGPLQVGTFFRANGEVALGVVDLLKPNQPYFVAPCIARNGLLTDLDIATVDVYHAGDADLVVSFLTPAGAPCVTAIHGTSAAGYTLTDITPTGAANLVQRPVLADLDTDLDPCPGLVNSDGGPSALRIWDGVMSGGHCTLVAAGATGTLLPTIPDGPVGAVAIGHIPLVPAIPGVASDSLVMSSGAYVLAPGLGFGTVYLSTRKLAHVAIGDLDGDGAIDAVLGAADEDDLDVLFRNPLGLELLRVDTASTVTSITIGDFDGNGKNDIAYTERVAGHQRMMIAYGTADRPLPPVQVAAFGGVASVTPLEMPDSVDTLDIATDLAVIQPAGTGAHSTISLLHGSPQRTMLSFYDPRSVKTTVFSGSVVGEFVGADKPDLLAIGTAPTETRAFRIAGTGNGLDAAAKVDGTPVSGLADCLTGGASGVCAGDAAYLAWSTAPHHDVVLAIDHASPPHAAMLDPWATTSTLAMTPLPVLAGAAPAGSAIRSLHAVDLDGDGTLELVASFGGAPGAAVAGKVVVCRVDNGVPSACDDVAPAISQVAPVTACIDAAPGRIGTLAQGTPLVVLCADAGGSSIYRVTRDGSGLHADALAHGTGLHAIKVGDVTGDGVDDVVAVQGDGGAQSLVVYPQCTTRNLDACQAASAAAEKP